MTRKNQEVPDKHSRKHGGVAIRIQKGLWWFAGFPVLDKAGKPLWTALQSSDSAEPVTFPLSGEHLSRAQRTLYTLGHVHRGALERYTGGAERWLAAQHRRLECYKKIVHEGRLEAPPIPKKFKERHAALVRAAPQLNVICEALRWCFLEDDEGYAAAFEALCALKKELKTLPSRGVSTVSCLQLIRSSVDYGSDRILGLLALLVHPALEHGIPVNMTGVRDALKTWLKEDRKNQPPAIEVYDFAATVRRWFSSFAKLTKGEVQRRLDLLGAAGIQPMLTPLRRWWDSYHELLTEFRGLATRTLDATTVKKLHKKINLLSTNSDFTLTWRRLDALFGTFDKFSHSQLSEVHAEIVALLECLPEDCRGAPIRAMLLDEWFSYFGYGSYSAHRVAAALRAMRALLSGATRTEGLELWTNPAPERGKWWRCYRFESVLSDSKLSESKFSEAARLFLSCRKLIAEEKQWPLELGCILLHTTDSIKTSHDIIMRLAPRVKEHWPQSAERVKLMWDVCGADIQRFCDLYVLFESMAANGDELPSQSLESLLTHARDNKDRELIASIFDEQLRGMLVDCGAMVHILKKLRVEPAKHAEFSQGPSSSNDLSWIDNFPNDLQRPLQVLALKVPDVRKAVYRLAAPHLRDPDELAAEISELEARLAVSSKGKESLKKRLENLRKFRTFQFALKPPRIAALRAKIEEYSVRAGLEMWRSRLNQQYRDAVADQLGIELPASEDPIRSNDLLSAIFGLSSAQRRLGIEVLKKRCGDPPWDFRELKENRKFLNQMIERGINMQPWLDGIQAQVTELKEKGTRTVQFEADPFEVLRMGSYFKTCLSVGSFNFFAAVTNAVDINKRVIYERDESGMVRGRALVALSDTGGVVVFPVFSHNPREGSRERIHAYVNAVATAMGAQLVPGGHVPKLVAKDWYADPPDVEAAATSDRAAVERLRKLLAANKIEDAIEELHGMANESGREMPLVEAMLAWPEIQEQPDRAIHLLPAFGSPRNLSAHSVSMLVRLFAMMSAEVHALVPAELTERMLSHLGNVLIEETVWVQVLKWMCTVQDESETIKFARTIIRERARHGSGDMSDMLYLQALAFQRAGKVDQARRFAERVIRRHDKGDENARGIEGYCKELLG